jgi:gamma-glutamyl:cysteine ligase YbdK (ATP-grasp superfamily)
MQQILQQHSLTLNQQLSEAAHTTLDRVVNEEQYHTMTNRLSAAITQKSEDNLARLNNDANRRLNANDYAFQSALSGMQKQVEDEIEALAEANLRSQQQSDQIKTLQSELSSLRWVVGICSASAVVVAGIGLFRYLQ